MSSSNCIISGAPINDGDRIVAVLTIPRIRMPAMPQEFGPTDPFHAASAASFPIRGTYDAFDAFVPDPGQHAVTLLLADAGKSGWKEALSTLHSEGLALTERRFGKPPETVRRPTAFAFVHEDVLDAVLAELGMTIDPAPALDALAALAAQAEGPQDERDRAVYRLITFHETSHLFGDRQQFAATARDDLGCEVMARKLETLAKRVLDGREAGFGSFREEARRLFECVADLTAFRVALDVAGAVLRPSVRGGARSRVVARIATMTLARILPGMVENDVEDDRPSPAMDAVVELAKDVQGVRSRHEDKVARALRG